MLIATLLLSLAAEPAVDVAAPRPTRVTVFPPTSEAVVPLNTRPIAFTDGNDIAFLLHRGDEVDTLSATTVATAPSLTMSVDARLLTLPALDEGASITLEPSCGDCVETFTWTTGPADLDAPAFVDEASSSYVTGSRATPLSTSSSWEIQVILPKLVVDEDIAFRLDGDLDGYGITGLIDTDVRSIDLFVDNTDDAYPEESEICFDVVAIDVAGNESAPLPVCVPLIDRDKEGCAQASSPSFGVLGLALLIVRRRR